MKRTIIFLFIIVLSVAAVGCNEKPSDQEIIAEYVADRFNEIDQHRHGKPLSLDEAETVLYCWAEGEDVTNARLQEAIYVVLECTDEIRDLIYNIDEIDTDEHR